MTGMADPQDGTIAMTGGADPVAVPSGQSVTLQDVIWNTAGPLGLTLRFRFLAPGIARNGGTVDVDAAQADMADLCKAFALPRISSLGPQPAQVIISLSDRDVPFGESDPEATQYFEAYRIENGECVWELY